MRNVYFFGDGHAEGSGKQNDLLGGKGANLADMTSLGMPVPAGFTITTEVCTYFMDNNALPSDLGDEISSSMHKIETIMNKNFGDAQNLRLHAANTL